MEQIKKFVEYEKTNFSENKILTIIYALFSFFFIFVPCALHVIFYRCTLMFLLIPCFYFLAGFLLFIWLYSTKNASSPIKHYALQSALLLALTAVFVCLPIMNLYANKRTLTYIHMIAFLIGFLFLILTCYFRNRRWMQITKKIPPRKTNSKALALIGIITFLVMSLLTAYFKSLGDDLWTQFVEGGAFIVSLVFFSLFTISISNIYIINKYVQNK